MKTFITFGVGEQLEQRREVDAFSERIDTNMPPPIRPKLPGHSCGQEVRSRIVDPLAKGIDLTPLVRAARQPEGMRFFHAGAARMLEIYNLTGKVAGAACSIRGGGDGLAVWRLCKL